MPKVCKFAGGRRTAKKCKEERCRETQEDVGRYGKIRGGTAHGEVRVACGEIRGDTGMCTRGVQYGDSTGIYGEI